MISNARDEEGTGAGMNADVLARRTFYITLIACLAFALAVFAFVL